MAGQGDDTLYYSGTQDTLFGGGGHDTVVFQDTPGTTNNVSLKYPDPNADNPNVIGVTINGQEVLWPQINASITTVGIERDPHQETGDAIQQIGPRPACPITRQRIRCR